MTKNKKEKRRLHFRELAWGWRALINVTLCLALLCAGYYAEGMPSLTPEMAYRRAERRALIGSGKILGSIAVENWKPYTRIVAGEYGDAAAALFAVHRDSALGSGWGAYEGGALYLAPKEEGVTVIAAPAFTPYFSSDEEAVYLAAFDDCPEAERAKMELHVSGKAGEESFAQIYSMQSLRQNEGVFFFVLRLTQPEPESGTTAEMEAFRAIATSCAPRTVFYLPEEFDQERFPIRLTFYDGGGNVLAVEETELGTSY